MQFRHFIQMWAYPRMVAWFLFGTFLLILARCPFAATPVLTGLIEFRPSVVLIPMAGIYAGPAGILCVLVASPLGDGLVGLWGPLTPVRAVASGLAAWMAHRLWDSVGQAKDATQCFSWEWVRYVLVSLPSLMALGAWPALVGAMLRLYPFSYLLGLHLVLDVLFLLLLAPLVCTAAERWWQPAFGTWRSVMRNDGEMTGYSLFGDTLIWVGGLAACALGLLTSGLVYGTWPWDSYVLGQTDGWVSWILVLVCLLLQVVGLMHATPQAPQSGEAASSGRFERFYLPPVERS